MAQAPEGAKASCPAAAAAQHHAFPTDDASDATHSTTIPWVSTTAVQWKRAPAATVWRKCAAAADARKFYGNATDDGATRLSTIQSAAVRTGKWIHVTVRGEEW